MLPLPLSFACLLVAAAPAPVSPRTDPFGITELFPSKPNGTAWYATSWSNGKPRDLLEDVDPMDPWFDTTHGSGRYAIDGKGTLAADGDVVRMYVHDPDRRTEWAEDLEITAYITRIRETKRVDYSGPQIFARTNHGTFTGVFPDEDRTPCDDRGLAGKINLDGTWAFEKETHHGADEGYATAGATRYWPSGFPTGRPVGVKVVLRNVLDTRGEPRAVRLALYVDMTDGTNGGSWTRVTDYTDEGEFGRGHTPCAQGVDPALVHVRSRLLESSETGRPELTVYFRHEYGIMQYRRLSVREIEPLAPDEGPH